MGVPARHQLVWLRAAGWSGLDAQVVDDDARACVSYWAHHGLPLVVTQQTMGTGPLPGGDTLALGLAGPQRWGRRRIALRVPTAAVDRFGAFPLARDVSAWLPGSAVAQWLDLCNALDHLGVSARVHGSYGWQVLTGLDYLRPTSDLDLHVPIHDARTADAVMNLLNRVPFATPRLDGELIFADGAAVAWREWHQWRQGQVDRVLVKRPGGVALERGESIA